MRTGRNSALWLRPPDAYPRGTLFRRASSSTMHACFPCHLSRLLFVYFVQISIRLFRNSTSAFVELQVPSTPFFVSGWRSVSRTTVCRTHILSNSQLWTPPPKKKNDCLEVAAFRWCEPVSQIPQKRLLLYPSFCHQCLPQTSRSA